MFEGENDSSGEIPRKLSLWVKLTIIAVTAVVFVGVFLSASSGSYADSVPGSCLVLEEEYCGMGELVEDGPYMFIVGFPDIPSEAVLFTPYDGELDLEVNSAGGASPMNTVSISRFGSDGSSDSEEIFRAAFVAIGALDADGTSMSKGEPIGLVANTGPLQDRDYVLVVAFGMIDADLTPGSSLEDYKRLFGVEGENTDTFTVMRTLD